MVLQEPEPTGETRTLVSAPRHGEPWRTEYGQHPHPAPLWRAGQHRQAPFLGQAGLTFFNCKVPNVLLPAKRTNDLTGSFLSEAKGSEALKCHQAGHPLPCFFLMLAACWDLDGGEIHSDTCY